jgi:hypothetical protein
MRRTLIKRIVWSYAALCLIALAACASFDAPKPTLKYPGFVTVIKINPQLPTLGIARTSLGVCEITLREYPICLLHEIRHCVEGSWHEGRETDEDCY